MDIIIRTAVASSSEVNTLSDELHKVLELIYGKGLIENFREENDQMIVFYVAFDGSETAVACGALKHIDESTAEIKRMYVKENYRGRGISKKILSKLEEHSKKLNYKRLILETGLKQPEAMSLYKKFGYNPINCYGRHASDPDSRCFEKNI